MNSVLQNDEEEPPKRAANEFAAAEESDTATAIEQDKSETEQPVEGLQTLEDSVITELLGDASPRRPDRLDGSNGDMSFDIFNGFDEPFSADHEANGEEQVAAGPITVGSTEWCQGLAKDANGRFIHVSLGRYFILFYLLNDQKRLNECYH